VDPAPMKGTLHSCSLLCLVEGQRLFIVSAGSNQEGGAGSNELAGRGVHTQPRALACISYRLMSGTHHRSATHADHHYTTLGIPSAVQRPALPAHSHTYACMHASTHPPAHPLTHTPPFHTTPPPLGAVRLFVPCWQLELTRTCQTRSADRPPCTTQPATATQP
jgi:hypothetical protein